MFNKLTDRVYYMDFVQEGDRPVLGLVVGDKDSLIIDGGNSNAHAEEFLSNVEKMDIPKPKYLALTHWHWDHVFGIKKMNLINIVHEKSKEKIEWMRTLEWTNEKIKERVENGEEIEFCLDHIQIEHPNNNRKIEIPHIDITFKEKLEIDLGGVTVILEHIDVDHSEDSVLVTVKEEKVTFMGDSMYLDMYHGPWSYSREKLYPFLDTIESYNSKYYIPSHHNKYTREEFKAFIKYIKEVGDTVGSLTNLDKAVENVSLKLKEWDIEDVKGFVEGNKKR